MSFFKKLFVAGSSVALMASGLLVPSSALAAAHGAGSVVKEPGSQTVWFIKDTGRKAAFTSGGAFMTYGFLSFAQVVDANSDDLALATDPFIAPRDGSIFCATMTKGTDVAGECSLITGGMKAAFTSASVFAGQGYSFARANYGDSSFLAKTSNIDNAGAAHRQGALVNFSGTVYLMGTSTLLGIPSIDVFNSWGYSFADVVTANAADMSITKSGVMCARVAGQLNPSFTAGSCGTPPGPGPELTGEGTVEDFSVGSPDQTDISEGQSDVELVAFDVELADDGSLELNRFDLYMGELNGGDESSRPWDYFTDAHLLVNGDEVASMSVDSSDDWTEYDGNTLGTTSQEYRLRFTGLSSILASGETSTVSVAFDSEDNIDSADEDATWQFGTETDSFRFTDGTGFVFTDGEDLADSFTMDTAEVADLAISAASDDPDAHVIEVSRTSDTTGEVLGMFDIEESEGVDTNISEITVELATSDTITDVVKKLYLYNGATLVGQETVTGTTVVFEDIDLDVDADDTVTLTVKADLDDTNDDARYQNGDTLEIDDVDITAVTDEFDNDENDINLTGTYASETNGLFTEGIIVDNFESSYIVNSSDTVGVNETVEFTLEYDVTAFGDDVWVDQTCVVGTTGTDVDATEVSLDGDANGNNTSCTSHDSTGTDGTDGFEVQEDQTEHFTVTVIGNGGEAGVAGNPVTFRARLNGIGYNLTTDDAGDTVYNFNLDDFKSAAVTVYDR